MAGRGLGFGSGQVGCLPPPKAGRRRLQPFFLKNPASRLAGYRLPPHILGATLHIMGFFYDGGDFPIMGGIFILWGVFIIMVGIFIIMGGICVVLN